MPADPHRHPGCDLSEYDKLGMRRQLDSVTATLMGMGHRVCVVLGGKPATEVRQLGGAGGSGEAVQAGRRAGVPSRCRLGSCEAAAFHSSMQYLFASPPC